MAKKPHSTEPLVVVTDAAVRFNRNRVLKVANFQVSRGQHWCVFGGNGAGKTLLARLIRGELPSGHRFVSYAAEFSPDQNMLTVSFEEQQRLWEQDNRRDVSEYQDDAIDKGTTVAKLVGGGSTLRPGDDGDLMAMLQSLGIQQLANSGIRYLSSGQVRKALIARALWRQRHSENLLLILDEPLEAIDKESQATTAALLQKGMADNTATLLLCRRAQDILPGITHMAIMEDLQITRLGGVAEVVASAEYKRITTAPRAVSLQISAALESSPGTSPTVRKSTISPIRLVNVTASYGDKKVLSDVNWTMGNLHNTLIEGPNGCGKSTLLSLIDGENHKAYGQEVFLFGRRRGSGESVWQIKSHFGVISNEIHNKYLRGWKVLEVVISGFFDSVGLYDDSGASQISTAKSWLQRLGLEALTSAYYAELSFGQQRLILLARAMVKQPEVLILDEPCVGLDDYHRRLILLAVDWIASQTVTQIIFVSHTEGEEPNCINQRVCFKAVDSGGYTLEVT